MEPTQPTPGRVLSAAERYTPELLQGVLARLEATTHSREVWQIIVETGRTVGLPFVDFVSASGMLDWRPTLFVRTSYDADWLMDQYRDPDLRKWSFFRQHALSCLTPLVIGIDFADEYPPVPPARVALLREAAERGMRAGLSIPLRQNAPPQAALLTFSGDHGRREMRAIVKAHGWTLHAMSLIGHQRYLMHFAEEFTERNEITDKQRALLELIGLGLQDKAIAERLGVSISAVRQRMNSLCAKTGLGSRAELAALAMTLGILPDPLRGPTENGPTELLVEMDPAGVRRAPAPRL
ncbi:Autoinducer binding domain protein [Roseivivax jejudonensis]|uniref:Autoinducer binding domain protein n=1 Tax=Roseivivax jejudonensis TaxID=1529041 RepID=A0A1X6Y385_9RHOB|nr:autoinducer binding domain-containing protein [Roseivivax jejudonensis]SLN09588.1 Autoinducer binding domain protein [Roseivivax jejudonensis]